MRILPLLALLLGSLSAAQPPADPPPAYTLESVATGHRPLIKQRALKTYRMPDGSIWDGWAFFEMRRIMDYAIKPYNRMARGRPAPGQTFVEDRVIGTVWKVSPSRDTEAWGLIGRLARSDGEIPRDRFEKSDRRTWTDIPPLWFSAEHPDHAWDFAYVNESDPDPYTSKVHENYLTISRDWGDGRFNFKGYTLDRGPIEGILRIREPRKWVKNNRLKGEFFLWPVATAKVAGKEQPTWDLLPADELRVSPDDLAAAVLSGRAQVLDWKYSRSDGRLVWHRTVRPIDPAPAVMVRKAGPRPAPVITPEGGPDLLILNDGRWFRGRITRKDSEFVVIQTLVGAAEMEMTFRADEVKETHTPEKR